LEAKLLKLIQIDPLLAMNLHVFFVHNSEMLEELPKGFLILHERHVHLRIIIEVINFLPLCLLVSILVFVLNDMRNYF
jgi:hypothetical protein